MRHCFVDLTLGMQINDQVFEKLCRLSGLSFQGEEKEKMKSELEELLEFVSRITTYDAANECFSLHSQNLKSLRPDQKENSLGRDQALRNVLKSENGYFIAPKVIDQNKNESFG